VSYVYGLEENRKVTRSRERVAVVEERKETGRRRSGGKKRGSVC
jgi:hypothetical protein